jgi:hypothetical protein
LVTHLQTIKQPDLTRQRLRFVPRLIAAAGYSGWVLLLDEVELVGRYSVLQRRRSYAGYWPDFRAIGRF